MKEIRSHLDSSRSFCLFTNENLNGTHYYILKCDRLNVFMRFLCGALYKQQLC